VAVRFFSPIQAPGISRAGAGLSRGLRERGYYDMAIEYLEQMKTSPLAPVDFKETLLYELGTTLIQSSREQRDIKLREAQLEEAAGALQQFVGMMPDHPLVTSANSQLGNLKVERARIKVEQSKLPNAKKEQLLAKRRRSTSTLTACSSRLRSNCGSG
jgi:cellulose synthase operon protein C